MLSTWVTPLCASSSMFLAFQIPPPSAIRSVPQVMSMLRSVRLFDPILRVRLTMILILRHLARLLRPAQIKKGAICVAPFRVLIFLTLKFRISNQLGVYRSVFINYFHHRLNHLRKKHRFYPLDKFSNASLLAPSASSIHTPAGCVSSRRSPPGLGIRSNAWCNPATSRFPLAYILRAHSSRAASSPTVRAC